MLVVVRSSVLLLALACSAVVLRVRRVSRIRCGGRLSNALHPPNFSGARFRKQLRVRSDRCQRGAKVHRAERHLYALPMIPLMSTAPHSHPTQ